MLILAMMTYLHSVRFLSIPAVLCGASLLPSCRAFSQSAVAAAGSVSGVILCGDTQRPARFANVTLTPVKSSEPDLKGLTGKGAKDDPAAAMKALTAMMGSVTMLQAQTGLDGAYTLGNVAPGDYYLIPSAPGYVAPGAAATAAAPDDATSAVKMAGVPVVHVEANRASRGDATLERGAALNGSVIYDDGSPAANVVVRFEDPVKAERKAARKRDDDDMSDFSQSMSMAMAGGMIFAKTDDRGRFRLSGVPAGEYTVQATVTLRGGFAMRAGVMDVSEASHPSSLVYYSPGTLHMKDARKIKVGTGEERSDIEIKVDLSGMHAVSGTVASAVDHHLLNAGSVTLVDTTDKTVKRAGAVDSAGTFTVSYVPPGTYTLEVSDAADTEPAKKKPGSAAMIRFQSTHTVRSYEDATQPVIVAASDVTGIHLELKESKSVKKDLDLNEFLGAAAGKGKE